MAFAQADDRSRCYRRDVDACLWRIQLGDAAAAADLGVALERQGQHEKATYWYRWAAERGDDQGQVGLGNNYGFGRGVPKDDTQAVYWYRMAAEQGNRVGQYNLGVHLRDGLGVVKNLGEAVYWFLKSAKQGFPEAQYAPGSLYAYGLGVPQDLEKAESFFRMAAEKGIKNGMVLLGQLLAFGPPLHRNPIEAMGWFKEGMRREMKERQSCANADCVDSTRYYGMGLEHGLGGSPDPQGAREIYRSMVQVTSATMVDTPLLPKAPIPSWQAFKRDGVRPKAHQLSRQCRSEPMVWSSLWPHAVSTRGFDRELDVAVEIEGRLVSQREAIERRLRHAARILADCGVRLRRAQFFEHEKCSPEDLSKLHERPDNESRLVIQFSQNDNVDLQAVLGESVPGANVVNIFLRSGSDEVDEVTVLAHQLGHQLGNLGHPSDFTPSIMHYDLGAWFNPRFTAAQCSKIRQSKLLFPASRAQRDRDIVIQAMPESLKSAGAAGGPRALPRALQAKGETELAAFYEMKEIFEAGLSAERVPAILSELANRYEMKRDQIVSVYANLHLWRPENGWPVKREDLKTYSSGDLFWLPGFNWQEVRTSADARGAAIGGTVTHILNQMK